MVAVSLMLNRLQHYWFLPAAVLFYFHCFSRIYCAPQQRTSPPLGALLNNDFLSTMLAQLMPAAADIGSLEKVLNTPQQTLQKQTLPASAPNDQFARSPPPAKLFDGQSNDKLLRLAVNIAGPLMQSFQQSLFGAPTGDNAEGMMASILNTLKRPDVFQDINQFIGTIVNEHVKPALDMQATLYANEPTRRRHTTSFSQSATNNGKKPDKLQYEPTPPTVNEYPLSELNKMASNIEFLFKNSNPQRRNGFKRQNYEQPIVAPPLTAAEGAGAIV